MNKETFTIESAGSNVIVIPHERTNDTWVGLVYSVGKNGMAHINRNNLVMYHNDDVTEFDLPSFKDQIPHTKLGIIPKDKKIHSIVYYKIIAVLRREDVKSINFDFSVEKI